MEDYGRRIHGTGCKNVRFFILILLRIYSSLRRKGFVWSSLKVDSAKSDDLNESIVFTDVNLCCKIKANLVNAENDKKERELVRLNIDINSVLVFIFNIIYIVMWFGVLNLSLTKRYSRKFTYLIQALWIILYRAVTVWLPFMSGVRMILFMVIFLALNLLCYTDSKRKIIFASEAILAIVITNEVIGAGLYFPQQAIQGALTSIDTLELISFWGIYLASGGVLLFFLYVFLNRSRFSFSSGDWGMLALFPVSQYALMYGWLYSFRLYKVDRPLFFPIIMVACILADIGFFKTVASVSQRAVLAAENDMLAVQVESQEKHYAALTAQYESIRRMRHDIANHINAVKSLFDAGRNKDAQDYLRELDANSYDATLGLCENPVVDAFLHNRIEEARSSGIQVDARIELGLGLPVSNVDFIRIFGNLIDNAVESCTGAYKPELSIECIKAHGCLVIRTKNSVKREPAKNVRKIPELDRGIGKFVLADVAKKYNGSIIYKESDDCFVTEMILEVGV